MQYRAGENRLQIARPEMARELLEQKISMMETIDNI